jgi:predicted permease
VNGRWDLDALRAGGLVCLVVAVPLTIVASVVDSDSAGLNALLFFGALFGFVVGAGCAAWVQRRGTPISHGMVAAAGAYLIAQIVFVAVRLVRGDDVDWLAIFFTLSLVLGAGLVGGVLGRRLIDRGIRPGMSTGRGTT